LPPDRINFPPIEFSPALRIRSQSKSVFLSLAQSFSGWSLAAGQRLCQFQFFL
jgi:hypothetical protein